MMETKRKKKTVLTQSMVWHMHSTFSQYRTIRWNNRRELVRSLELLKGEKHDLGPYGKEWEQKIDELIALLDLGQKWLEALTDDCFDWLRPESEKLEMWPKDLDAEWYKTPTEEKSHKDPPTYSHKPSMSITEDIWNKAKDDKKE